MYISTREKLQHILTELLKEKSMDKITVGMVADRAGVSRQTFYNHYGNIMEVLRDTFAGDLKKALEGLGRYERWTDALKATFYVFIERRKIIMHVYRSSYRDEFMRMLEDEEAHRVLAGIIQCEQKMGIKLENGERIFMQRVYLDTIMGMFDRFFGRNMEDDPERIADNFELVMGKSMINSMMRRQNTAGILT